MAVQDYELLLRVRADLQQALSGLGGLSTSLGEASKAADKAGESADAATQRIRAMVAETSKQAAVQESVRSTNERAAQSINTTIRSTEAQAASMKRTRDAVEAYRASMTKATAASGATAGLAAQRAEMAKLAEAIDPTIAKMAKLDEQERNLNALRKAGAVGVDDYNHFKAAIDRARMSVVSASSAMHKFNINTSQSRMELGRLIKDISTGQFGRLEQTGFTLASQSGVISMLFNPAAIAIAALTGALAGMVVAAEQVALENDKLNESIQQTGNYAGVTTGDIDKLAAGMANAKVSVGSARDVLGQLVASGRVSGQALGALGQAAVDMATLTGMSADKATASVLKMFDGTASGALKANEQYHFLTTSVYDQIKALEDEGNTQQAMALEAEAWHEAAVQRIQDMDTQLSGLARMWDNVKLAAGGAWERMKTGASLLLGTANDQTQLYDLLGKKEAAKNHEYSATGRIRNMFAGSGLVDKFSSSFQQWTPADEAKLQALEARINAAKQKADDAATEATLHDNAVNADAGLNRLADSVDKAYGKRDKIQQLNKYFEQLWAGADPNNAKLKGVQRIVGMDGKASFSGGLYDTLLADINKASSGGGHKGPDMSRQYAAANDALTKSLQSLQNQLDPVAAIWNRYNATVEKANADAALAKQARGANAAAIEGERTAVVALATSMRAAALDKLSEADRAAYEKLRDSLRTPIEVRLDKAMEEITQLNALLAKGAISSAEHRDGLQRIGQRSVTALPSYQGVGAAVGGVGGELAKNFQARVDLEKAYGEQAAALRNRFRAEDLAQQQAYVAAKEKLDADYAKKSQIIEQSRHALSLTASSNFFGQLSALSHSNNKKMAAVGKAAAIAKAMIDTFVMAQEAYKSVVGIPYIGPGLAVAAAASAVAVGMANVAQIRAQPTGFATGGPIRGPGTGTSDSITIRASDGEFMQREAAVRYYGEDFMHAVNNLEYPRDGLTSTAGFAAPRATAMPAFKDLSTRTAANADGVHQHKHVHVWDRDAAAQEIASTDHFQQAVLHVVGSHPSAIKARWGH